MYGKPQPTSLTRIHVSLLAVEPLQITMFNYSIPVNVRFEVFTYVFGALMLGK